MSNSEPSGIQKGVLKMILGETTSVRGCPILKVPCTREKCEHFTGKKTDYRGWNCSILHDTIYPPPKKLPYKPTIKFTIKLDTTFVEGKKHNTATFVFTFKIYQIISKSLREIPYWKVVQQMNAFFVSYLKNVLPKYQRTLKGEYEFIFVKKDIEDVDTFLADKETVKEHLYEELLMALPESRKEGGEYYTIYVFQEELAKTHPSLDFLSMEEEV